MVGVAEFLFSEDFVHDRGFGSRDRLEGEDTCSCGCSLVMFFSPWQLMQGCRQQKRIQPNGNPVKRLKGV